MEQRRKSTIESNKESEFENINPKVSSPTKTANLPQDAKLAISVITEE